MDQRTSISPGVMRNPRRSGWLAVALCAPLCFIGCGRSETPAIPAPVGVATVGTHLITEADVLHEAQRLRDRGAPVPGREALVKQMTEHAALLQHARAAGLDRDPDVRRALDDLLIARWRDRELQARLADAVIGIDELQHAYDQQRDDYVTQAKVRLAVLKLSASPRMSEPRRTELVTRLTEARRRILAAPAPAGRGPAATGFGALAIDFSDDAASRYRGGDMGWLDVGKAGHRLPEAVLHAGYALEKGVPSEILKEEQGYYLVMKTDQRPGSTNSFESVKESLRRHLQIARQNRIRLDMHREALAAFPADVDEQRLAALELPESNETASLTRQSLSPPSPKGGIAP